MKILQLCFSGLGLIRTGPRIDVGRAAVTVNDLDIYLPGGGTTSGAHVPTLAIPVDMLAETTPPMTFDRCVALWDPVSQAPRLWAHWFLDRASLSIADASGPTVLRHLEVEPSLGPLDASDPVEWSALNWLANLSYANTMALDVKDDFARLTSVDLSGHLKLNGGRFSVRPPSRPHQTLHWTFGKYRERAFSDSFKYVLANRDETKAMALEVTPLSGSSAPSPRRIVFDKRKVKGECFLGNLESDKVSESDAVRATQNHVATLYDCVKGGSPTALPVPAPGVNPVFCFLARV